MKVSTQVGLDRAVDRAELTELAHEREQEAAVGEEVVDEREDVAREVDRQLPGVLEAERLLIAQGVVADRVGRHISLVDRAHRLLVEAALARQLFRVVGLDRVDDQGVVDRDQVAPRAVQRVGEAAGLAGERPALGADGLGAVVGVRRQPVRVEHLAPRQVAGEAGKVLAHPASSLLHRRHVLVVDHRAVEDQTQAGLALERDHPEPQALGTEMIGGQPGRQMPRVPPLGLAANLLRGEIGQAVDVDPARPPTRRRRRGGSDCGARGPCAAPGACRGPRYRPSSRR